MELICVEIDSGERFTAIVALLFGKVFILHGFHKLFMYNVLFDCRYIDILILPDTKSTIQSWSKWRDYYNDHSAPLPTNFNGVYRSLCVSQSVLQLLRPSVYVFFFVGGVFQFLICQFQQNFIASKDLHIAFRSWLSEYGRVMALCLAFPKQALVFTCLQYKSFENTVGKGKLLITSNFFFSLHFLPIWITFCHFH